MSQFAPEVESPRGGSGGTGPGRRRRRILGQGELKSLLASSTLKMQQLMVRGRELRRGRAS